MIPTQRIVRERRQYNQWVATETLEDYTLRFTAGRARKSSFRVGNTALGPIAFLACEAIGASITVAYGFQNAVWAITAFTLLMFLIGLPIAYYASRYGVDIDLLTRGAGFGYMGDTLLVVDDTPETLGFLTDTLDGAGFTVLIATDGASALELVDQITPDLVLMDAVMPGLDGFETCRRLKNDKLLTHLPVIFMTGLSETEDIVGGWPPAASITSPSPL